MPKILDLTGVKFGRLTAITPGPRTRNNRTTWVCRCECGSERPYISNLLRLGHTKSCGCLKAEMKRVPDDSMRAGERFGRWTVIDDLGVVDRSLRMIVAKCDCGTVRTVKAYNLWRGASASCGCGRRRESSAAWHPLRRLWQGMMERCSNPGHVSFHNYGGRGIRVCDEWLGLAGFWAFAAYMGDRPSPAHSVDRIDVNGNYGPGNCRWASPSEQTRNARTTVLSEKIVAEARERCAAGETAAAVARSLGVSVYPLRHAVRGTSWKPITPTPFRQ